MKPSNIDENEKKIEWWLHKFKKNARKFDNKLFKNETKNEDYYFINDYSQYLIFKVINIVIFTTYKDV